MLNIIHNCRQVTLLKSDDPVGHLCWRKPGIVPNDAHDGNVDVWKNVCWGAKNRERPKDQNQDSQYYERVRLSQCDSNNPHNSLPSFLLSGMAGLHQSNRPYDLCLGVLASKVETSCSAAGSTATLPDRTMSLAGIFLPYTRRLSPLSGRGWSLRGRLQQTSRAPLSSSRFRL